jgi:hypothetical protein
MLRLIKSLIYYIIIIGGILDVEVWIKKKKGHPVEDILL